MWSPTASSAGRRAGHAWTSVQPGLLEAPIPTCWLLGSALPPGRGVAPRLQEMVGEGAEERGDEGRGARGGGLLRGSRGQDCLQGELGAPQPVPTAHAAESRAQGGQRPHPGPVVRAGGEAVTRLPELRGCWVVDGHQVEEAAGSGRLSSAPGPQAGKRRGPLSEPLPVDRLPLGLRARPSSKSWSFLDGGPSACQAELPGHPVLG